MAPPELVTFDLLDVLVCLAACNLHTAIALVSKMKAMGIKASCNMLVMQPSLALQRRKQQQSQHQVRCRPQQRLPSAKFCEGTNEAQMV